MDLVTVSCLYVWSRPSTDGLPHWLMPAVVESDEEAIP